MIDLRNISIRRKLLLIIMIITAVSLLMANTAFIAIDYRNAQKAMAQKLGTVAEIIAANSSAAILFGDNAAARETLAFLDAQTHIEAAVIYGADGEEFASYRKKGFDGVLPKPDLQQDKAQFWSDHVELFAPVMMEGSQEGFVYLRSDMRFLDERVTWFMVIVAIVLVASLLVAFALSQKMQHIITDPLLRLSNIARQITTEKNYSLRVVGGGRDEIGRLMVDFNAMLDEIQQREEELSYHKAQLEERVAQRTSELETANQELEVSKEKAESVARRMEYHAHHDSLTGLPNRALLNDRINTELAHARRQQSMTALLFLDLDRFKIINDSLGHAIGDQLLQVVARRLKNCVREDDTVARLGGDEFMVLLPHISGSSDAGRIAKKIIEALLEPVSCNGHELHITTSVGISIYPFDGTDAETLVKNADISMYRAKELGRNKAIYYTAEMNTGSQKKLALETNLRKALANNELKLFYQPKIDISSNTIVGVEALLRWEHPTMGYISPQDFIPVAEDSGLIVPIGEWTLQTAFGKLREWHEAGHDRLTMAVNLSSAQLSRPGLDEVVSRAIRDAGIDPRLTELEVTENTAMQNIDTSIEALQSLKEMGVTIAMDDFGTGYSSLSYLRKLPIDIVKIDQSFVHDIPESKEDVLIAQAIIAMAQSLNLSLVVEGVENVKQLNFFRQQGCNIVQGYLFSEPAGPEHILKLLQEQEKLSTFNLVG